METVLPMQGAHMQRGIMPVFKALYLTLYKRDGYKKGHISKKILPAVLTRVYGNGHRLVR